MNKTASTLLKRLIVMAIVIVMCLGMTIPAMANEATYPARATDQDNPAQAVITKLFKMPESTTIPSGATFPFNFTKVSYNGEKTTAALDAMPAPSAAISVALATNDTRDTANGIDTITKDTGDIGAKFGFTQEGEYVYTVAEGDMTGYTPAVPADEHFVKSEAEYKVTFWVKKKPVGAGYYIDAIGVVKQKNDDGSSAGNVKIDLVNDPAGFTFTNKYYKDSGEQDPTKDTALGIAKMVDTQNSFGDVNRYFAFSVVVSKPSAIPTGVYDTYKVYIRNATTKQLVDITASHTNEQTQIDSFGEYFNVTPGTSFDINLKHNEELVFAELPVGAKYTATEKATLGYTASVAIKENNVASSKNGTTNTALDTDQVTPTARQRIIGELENSAKFTNVGGGSPITGVSMNDLPYIAILLLAVGAFVAFIVLKSRRREAQDN